MTITILFFSILRDLVGAESLTVSFDSEEVSLDEVLALLYGDYPALTIWDSRLLLAVNAEFATRMVRVRDGDEVALMPPVQGG